MALWDGFFDDSNGCQAIKVGIGYPYVRWFFLKIFQMSSDPKPSLFILMISMILSSFFGRHYIFHKGHDFYRSLKNQGGYFMGFWYHLVFFLENHLRTFWGNHPSVDVAFNGSKGSRGFYGWSHLGDLPGGFFMDFPCMRDSWISNTETYRNMCIANDMQTVDLENISKNYKKNCMFLWYMMTMLSIYLYRTNKFQPNVAGYAIVEGVLVFLFNFLSSDNIDKITLLYQVITVYFGIILEHWPSFCSRLWDC